MNYKLRNTLSYWVIVFTFFSIMMFVGCNNNGVVTPVSEATEASTTEVTPKPEEEIVIPTVTLEVVPIEKKVVAGGKATILLVLDPPVATNEITWNSIGDGSVEQTDDGEGVIFIASEEPGVAIIEVTGTTVDGATFSEKIVLEVIEPEPEPIEEPTATVTAEPEPTEAPEPEFITLDNLEDGQEVVCENAIEGTYLDEVIEPIWPVLTVDGIWYPQDQNFQPATKINGKWTSVVRFGICTEPQRDVGKTFQLLIIRANEECHQQFNQYFIEAQQAGDWPGILNNDVVQSCKDGAEIALSLIRK